MPTADPTAAPISVADVTTLAVRTLREWTQSRERQPSTPDDSDPLPPSTPTTDVGVPALAALLAGTHPDDETTTAVAARAVASWARTAGRGSGHHGLFSGGLAGTLAGLRFGARLHPALNTVADRLHTHLATPQPRRQDQVTITDYDLIVGPAGTLHALLLADTEAAPLPQIDHLALLASDPDLRRLRAGQDDRFPELDWLQGRVNTGMGHGVAGLLTALTATVRQTAPTPRLTRAIHHLTHWLTAQSFDDARAIRSWDGAGLEDVPLPGARARQAWCYGAPGICWALWDAADAVGDKETAEWAESAFTTLCAHYDETFHLYGDPPTDRLACCHGAAGVLAVADAFHHHAHHPGAATLRTRLTTYLTAHLHELPTLAAQDMGLLGGATGILCALLTATTEATSGAASEAASGVTPWRAWTRCLGLR